MTCISDRPRQVLELAFVDNVLWSGPTWPRKATVYSIRGVLEALIHK